MLTVNQLVGFGAVLEPVYTALPVSAVSSTFTFGGGGAAEANLYDGNDATGSADPAGLTSVTRAAYSFSGAKSVRRIRLITRNSDGGFSNSCTFNIRYSDTSLTTGFSTVSGVATQIIAAAGQSQLSVVDIDDNGSHLHWAIEYASGTTGGNAHLGELTFYELI